jgi:Ca-activated chloride channel family protein
LTDGEITEGSAILPRVLERAKQMNVPIVTVGMGTPQGRPIPDGTAFWGETAYKRDSGGAIHISHLDEETLRQIADSTQGSYISGDSEQSLGSIDSALDKLQKTMMKGQGGMKREELSHRLALGAAFSLFLASVL